MTTARRRVLPINHKTLDALEVLFLVLLDEHRGHVPLRIKQVHTRMKPHAVNEGELRDQGYIRPAEMARGKPSPLYVEITPEGREALKIYYAASLARLDNEIGRQTIDEQRAVMRQLAAELRKPYRLERYVPEGEEAAMTQPAEDDDDDRENDELESDEEESLPVKPRGRPTPPAKPAAPQRRTPKAAPKAPKRRDEED